VSAGTGVALTGAFAGLTTAVPRTAPASRIVLDSAADLTRPPKIVRPDGFWAQNDWWFSAETGVSTQYADEVGWMVGGRGHAFPKHVGELPWINSQQDLADYVASIMRDPSEAAAFERGRFGYWDAAHDAIVVIDPTHPDLGTVFLPGPGYDYFLDQIVVGGTP
jgi:hypothetical protein